jgi:flagellar assembly factor FliW
MVADGKRDGGLGMVIETRDFGPIEIQDDEVIGFPDGIYGFDDSRRFALLDTGSTAGMMHLQCVDSPTPRFIVLDPFMILEDYAPEIPPEAFKKLRAGSVEDLSLLVIAVIPQDFKASTVNLKSPIAINFKEHLGMQVILGNRDYSVRFRLFNPERTA